MNAIIGRIPSISWSDKLHDELLCHKVNANLDPDDAKVFVLNTGTKTRIVTVYQQTDNWLLHSPTARPNIGKVNRIKPGGTTIKITECDKCVTIFPQCKTAQMCGPEVLGIKNNHFAVITTFFPDVPGVEDIDCKVPLKPGFKQERLEYIFCAKHPESTSEVISNSSLNIRKRKLGSRAVEYIDLNDKEKIRYFHGIDLKAYLKGTYEEKKDQSGAQRPAPDPNIDPFVDRPDGRGYGFSGKMGNPGSR
ncbi:hypothetical protein [Endozoicomonas sp. ONNA2]|uniref:hypothetical protein n=1 Tax=Endozoicomonas sp. ONNA2 TaxID=2828741 RepID=UPI0021499762|nr:hypothetical protein [Endozoicomonas sp. ONNA2]